MRAYSTDKSCDSSLLLTIVVIQQILMTCVFDTWFIFYFYFYFFFSHGLSPCLPLLGRFQSAKPLWIDSCIFFFFSKEKRRWRRRRKKNDRLNAQLFFFHSCFVHKVMWLCWARQMAVDLTVFGKKTKKHLVHREVSWKSLEKKNEIKRRNWKLWNCGKK